MECGGAKGIVKDVAKDMTEAGRARIKDRVAVGVAEVVAAPKQT